MVSNLSSTTCGEVPMGGHRTAYQTVEGRHRGEGAVRLAGCAGVVGVLLATGAFVLDQMWLAPATTWTSAQIAASVGRHREALLVAMFFNTATVSLLLVFGAGSGCVCVTRPARRRTSW